MKVTVFGLLVIMSTNKLVAQVNTNEQFQNNSASANITRFEDNKDGSVYTGMFEILKSIHPITYVGAAYYYGHNRPFALREGEGKNGYLFEVNSNLVFPVWQGRNQGSHLKQRLRAAIKYAPAFRMALDSSLPVIPTNQRVGVEFAFAIWNNYTERNKVRNDNLHYAEDITWVDKTDPFTVVHLLLDIMHYSNGQPPGVYYLTSPVKRHDYLGGDFSTNYFSVMGVASHYQTNHSLLSGGLGYRADGGVGNALSFNPEQEKRYGKHRLQLMAQFRSRPVSFGKLEPWTELSTGKRFFLRNKISHRLRLESEYILGNLENFDRKRKTRLGTHFYWELDFASSRTAGLVLHLYHGRDYLNIRYDDVVTGGNLGISLNLLKYTPPRLKSNAFISGPSPENNK